MPALSTLRCHRSGDVRCVTPRGALGTVSLLSPGRGQPPAASPPVSPSLCPAEDCPLQHPASQGPGPAVPSRWGPGRVADAAQPRAIPQFPLSHTELPPSEFMQVADSTWLVLSVVSNGRAPSGCQATGVTKIARSVIAPLAEHHVSVLMLSTYQTDFILVRERDLPVVIHTLAGEFDIYKEENGESIPVPCDDASNGFLKPKSAASPTLHPVQSPQNRFCILTVAPDTLPAIATMLIDVLFYSHGPPKEPSAGDLDSITFFSFSLIEGYISIVMDAETQKRFPSDLLLTSSSGELWRMVRIGGQPLGFDECGIVAQIAEPLAAVDISAYYISTFNFDHALVPEEGITEVIELLQKRQESGR
ncbi:cytosolic arginine sensor for mTORC1 subunit 1 isoform X1 [Numida meleagris]|uniref:cytosolic arginine sensor for mTORC1 subunit 1 isoform X1 n=1 Tax=Numida meleagris TaxID=8996 RepID=UPI000B3E18EE|nr:cytosolic arginine sensor for mTORC1 subunit 1 isoform X1 [Numida meleagris]